MGTSMGASGIRNRMEKQIFYYPSARVEVPFDYSLLTIFIQLLVHTVILCFIKPLVVCVSAHGLSLFTRQMLLMQPGAVSHPLSYIGHPVSIDFAENNRCVRTRA